MSLLLLFGGSSGAGGGLTPITTAKALAIVTPDEVATGVSTRLWVQYVDNTATYGLDSAPQLTIWRIPSSGTRAAETAIVAMTAAGNGWYFDWAPTVPGVFLVTVAGLDSAAAVFTNRHVTARPKFDPIALSMEGVLVSRM